MPERIYGSIITRHTNYIKGHEEEILAGDEANKRGSGALNPYRNLAPVTVPVVGNASNTGSAGMSHYQNLDPLPIRDAGNAGNAGMSQNSPMLEAIDLDETIVELPLLAEGDPGPGKEAHAWSITWTAAEERMLLNARS